MYCFLDEQPSRVPSVDRIVLNDYVSRAEFLLTKNHKR